MNCREAEEHLFAADDGALAAAERAALASHIDACAACRRIRNDLTVFVETWRAETEQVRVPDAGLEWRKLQRTLAANTEPRRSRIGWFALPSAALAAAAVAVGIYLGFGHGPAQPALSTMPRVAMAAPNTEAIATMPAAAMPSVSSQTSTVVFVDDKSGWTFVWDNDSGRHI